MTFDYSGLSAIAVAQVADKGRDVTYVYTTQGTYDASTDSISGQSSTSAIISMLVTNFNFREIDGTLIKSGDRLGLIANGATLSRVPKTGDQVNDGGETFTVVSILNIQPGEEPLLYKLQLRR